MRRVRYSVATSADGFIAGPNGEYDWICVSPDIHFAELYREFDTLLMGRRTYEVMLTAGQTPKSMGMRAFVVSKTLSASAHPDVTVLRGNFAKELVSIKAQPGKDIWLFGGGVLFRSVLDAGLVDSVQLAVSPVMLGGGIPVLPPGNRCGLRLNECKPLSGGVVLLTYDVSSSHGQ